MDYYDSCAARGNVLLVWRGGGSIGMNNDTSAKIDWAEHGKCCSL